VRAHTHTSMHDACAANLFLYSEAERVSAFDQTVHFARTYNMVWHRTVWDFLYLDVFADCFSLQAHTHLICFNCAGCALFNSFNSFGCTHRSKTRATGFMHIYFESFGFIFILQQSNNLSNKLTLFNNK
jgi:hypothetical protein